MDIKPILVMMLVGIALIVLDYNADEPYRKQVAEFTKKCHDQNGVVVQEHDTKNILCFPSDF